MRKKFILISIILMFIFITGCGKEKGTTSELSGVSMITEKTVYKSDVEKINVFWINDTDIEYMFGDPFLIQMLVGNKWESIGKSDVLFDLGGILLLPHSQVKHTYNLRLYVDKLEKGEYRIVANFPNKGSNGDLHIYRITAGFEVE